LLGHGPEPSLAGGAQRPDFPNWNWRKIKLKKLACFSAHKNDRQHTTIYHQSTTQLPQKNHVLHLSFRKTPLQKRHSTTDLKIPGRNCRI
jgi:hypothetical protein